MTEQERKELIERMAIKISAERGWLTDWDKYNQNEKNALKDVARAALAVAEPVIRAQTESALREKNELLMQAWNEEKGFLNKYIDEIERLREENARLREALRPFAYYAEQIPADVSDTASASGTVGDLRAARAAIREGGKDA